MKRTLFSLLLLTGFSFLLTSCEKVVGEGPVVTQTRNAASFTGIDFRIPGNIEYRQDSTYKVEITAQQNILDVLESYVSSGRLILRFKNDVRVRDHEQILINITAPAQSSIRLSGSGNFRSTGQMITPNMTLDLSGSGNIFLDQLTTTDIHSTISGSGNITLDNGTGRDLQLKVSGSGNMDLADVFANRATTNISGSGDIRVRVANMLDATISGSGSVYYRGTPVISTRISGSGRVVPF